MIFKAGVLRVLMIATRERRKELRRLVGEMREKDRFEAGRTIKEIDKIDSALDVCHEVLNKIKFRGKVTVEE